MKKKNHDSGDILAFAIAVGALWYISRSVIKGPLTPEIKNLIVAKAEHYIKSHRGKIPHSPLTNSTLDDFLK